MSPPSEFFNALPWEIEEILSDDDEERQRRKEEWRRLSFYKKVRWVLSSPRRGLRRLWDTVSGKVAWHLWRKRALTKRLDQEKSRFRQLAGIPAKAIPLSDVGQSRYAPNSPWASADWSKRWAEHEAAMQSVVPPPAPPVVTDSVRVDYHMVLGKPYLVGKDGQKIEATIPKKVTRRRKKSTPTASKTRSRGKPRR